MSAAKYTELKTAARDCEERCPRSERQQHQPAWQFSLPPSVPQPPWVKDRVLLHAVEEITCGILCGVWGTAGFASSGFSSPACHCSACFLMLVWWCCCVCLVTVGLQPQRVCVELLGLKGSSGVKRFFRSYKGEEKLQWSEACVSAEWEFWETEVNFCSLEALVLLNSDVCRIPEQHVSISEKGCNDIF